VQAFIDAVGKTHKAYFDQDIVFREGYRCWRNCCPPGSNHKSCEDENMYVKERQLYRWRHEMTQVHWHHYV